MSLSCWENVIEWQPDKPFTTLCRWASEAQTGVFPFREKHARLLAERGLFSTKDCCGTRESIAIGPPDRFRAR